MAGVAIEDALELWAVSLREVKRRMRPLFTQERVAVSAGLFLDGLLGPERRKTGWMRAEAAGDPGPWRQQAILGRGRWEADALRDLVRDYALETLADAEAVLVIDETGFLKQGKASCGVARQYTGSAGKVTNCQVGVFAAYVSRHGHAFVDRALYLPKAWTDDPARLARRPRPARDHLRHQAPPRAGDDRAGDRGRRAVRLGGGRQRLRRGRDRDGAAPGRQGLRARRQRLSPLQLLGRQAAGGRHGGGDRPRRCPHRRGRASRPARGPRGRGSTTGPTWSWPTSRPPSTTTASPARGRGACWSGAASPTASSPSSRPGARPGPRSRRWSTSRGAAGRSRTRSRPPRPSSGWTTTRPAAGTAGTGTSRW